MPLTRGSRRRLLAVPLGVLMVALAVPASGQEAADPFAGGAPFDAYGFQGEGEARVDDVDVRTGVVPPSAASQAVAARLGATAARWNDFGTPHVLVKHGGYLTGPREGRAVDVARAFVREHADLFRLDAVQAEALTVIRDSPLYDSPDLARAYGAVAEPVQRPDVAHVITFGQVFEGLATGVDGLLTIGVQSDGRIAYVTSSVTGDTALSGARSLDGAAAVAAAARDVDLALGAITPGPVQGLYETFGSELVGQVQRARPVALPTPTEGVRRAWEVTLLDTELDEHGNPTAFVSLVDAETGAVWHRTNKVDHLAQGSAVSSMTLPTSLALPSAQVPAPPSGGAYSGTTAPGGCGPDHPIPVPTGTGQITVTGRSPSNPNADTVSADLVANIVYGGTVVATADTLGNPEVATYAPPAETTGPAGGYAARICTFSSDDPAYAYTGNYFLTPVGAPGGGGGGGGGGDLPTWKVFPANPQFVAGRKPADVDSPDSRSLWCWDSARFPDRCQEQQRNSAARTPWDVNGTSTPSYTTDGNFASTAISEGVFLAPDTFVDRPLSPTRTYEYPWTNAWFESSCDPTRFGSAQDPRGGTNDEAAATANLFVQHNRMHDWSYYLGFTEVNANLQKTNFGNTGPEREGDPELGQSQAGRRTTNGRDNANQVTLGDGIPGITNQYLWQPLAGAFYAPCVDGAYDQAVVAHEYGHAISNRMIGRNRGATSGTGATQGQSESWSDLVFAGYFTEFAISAGEGINPYVLGPYVTGDPNAGIRNVAMNNSPLNYSGLDYDPNGLGSPHANGEIWSATNFDVLTALSAKYDAQFPSTDKALQNRCARGELAADACPGNRRWNQIQFDSFLLQPSGATMVDSRDGMLAADVLRFGGANQAELWSAFAKRGLGEKASAVDAADTSSLPSFESPLRTDEAQVRFTAPPGVKDMKVHVGRFESSAIPVADTVEGNDTPDTALLVPGAYEFIATAPGSGGHRFVLNLAPGARTVEVPLRRNHASAANGGVASGDGVNLANVNDDTEATNWASVTSEGTASAGKGEGRQVEGRQVTIDLAGDRPVMVSDVQVSAALRPVPQPAEEDEELPTDPDEGTQSRFSALRSFNVLTCNAAAGADCSKAESFREVFVSPDNAFPSVRPRPRIVDTVLRPFDVTDSMATHVRLVARDNQCTGAPSYQGENNPDADPLFNPDCDTEAASADRSTPIGPVGSMLNPPKQQVRASEIQVFSAPAAVVDPPRGDTPGTLVPGMPGTTPPQGALTAQARGITQACPDDRVPRGSRADTRGNVHERAIDCVIWYEIAKGFDDRRYGPSVPVTREQMASFVARQVEVSGGTFPAGGDAFTDDEGSVHEASIDKLAAAKVINGTGGGRFDPRGTITRDQMATFLVKAYEYRSGRTVAPSGDYFADDAGNTHEGNINKSAEAGFTGGRDGGYQPREVVNRDAMASFLARSYDLLVEQGVTQPKR